ncbi:MAG: AAA family ATPase [bacterium]
MSNKFNPFKPNSPVFTGMFAGREKEINGIARSLFQTKNGNPNHILLVGERGIGKTSLLSLANNFAKNEIIWDEQNYNFLTIQINLSEKMTMADLAVSLKIKVERELEKINPEITLIKKCWDHILKIEAGGIKYRGSDNMQDEEPQICEKFTHSLVDTVKKLTQDTAASEVGITQKKDGMVILIDEADRANKSLNLGSFLKNLTEALSVENCNKILFILAGLPNIRKILLESHESSLRLFQEYELPPLSKNETDEVITRGIKEGNEASNSKITIGRKALDLIYIYSEGYPHFVQQIGYSCFEVNSDEEIDEEDIKKGFFMKGGALDLIGNRGYKKLYYSDINVDSQREILDIMADNWNDWVSRDNIIKKFSGKKTALNNGLRALKEKSIILIKEGERGKYRLQWASFAFWIKNHKKIQK